MRGPCPESKEARSGQETVHLNRSKTEENQISPEKLLWAVETLALLCLIVNSLQCVPTESV